MDQMMETPAWVKRFDDDSDSKPRHSTSCVVPSTSRNTETSWSFSSPSDQDLRSLHNSHDFPVDYFDGLSADKEFPCIRTAQSNCTMAEEERRKKKRRRQLDDTSGYSTTSLSEMSEFETHTKRDRRRSPSSHHLYVGRRRQSATDDRSEKSKVSQSTSRRTSEVSKTHSNRHLNELSKSSSRSDLDRTPHRIPRVHSSAESIGSLHSGRSARSNHTHRSNRSKSHTNTVQGKIVSSGSTDQSDPFAFIQPVPESFSSRLRKTLRPCMGVLIMLILAASLGAAIYFAIELKKTHEDEIEMLRANLAVKIKKTRYGKPLDELMQSDFKGIALDYCQQMDRYYQRSHFKSTYRGCEVISIKNEHINFTLFFLEKDATTKDIISVIDTASPKQDESGQNVAVEDKFEIELENVKITIEHKRTPVSFNKLSSDSHSEVRHPVKNDNKESGSSVARDISTSKAQTTTTATTTTTKQRTTTPPPSETDLAWTPCAFKSGSFFPHPIACNKYFQCEHGKSRLQTCTGNLLFDVSSDVCVEDRANLVCPDADAAPPAPPTSPPSDNIKKTSTTTPSTQTVHTTAYISKSRNSSLTSSIYPSRPAYSRTPCKSGKPGQLFPHPDNCLKFIQCIGPNKGVVQNCATDLVYDPETMACIFPRNIELLCPDLVPCEGIVRGYFPHPYTCSKYIQCESGSEVIQSCNAGLVWDPVINSCVFRTTSSICPNATKPV